MLFGAFGALVEKRIKKFFAYSSINQMGFLLMGVVGGSSESVEAAVIYLVVYVIMNIGVFVILLNTFDTNTKRQMLYLTDLTHFSNNNIGSSLILVVILFSMAGIPPLAGFFAKFYIFIPLFKQEEYLLILVALFTTLLSAYYYLKLIKYLLFDVVEANVINFQLRLSNQLKFVLTLVVVVLIFGFMFTNSVFAVGGTLVFSLY